MPTYLGALIFGMPLWLLLYIHRKDLRHKMIYMSILVAFIAPVDTFFIPSYWQPIVSHKLLGLPIDIFTVLFGFVLGGVASVLYEEVIKRTYIRDKKHHSLRYFIVIGPIVLYVLHSFTSLNFMHSVLIATILMVIVIIALRHDLIIDSLVSGLLFAVIYTVLLAIYINLFPSVLFAWNLHGFSQILIGSVPHYEIIWAFLSGAFLGPFYEFSHDFVLRKVRA